MRKPYLSTCPSANPSCLQNTLASNVVQSVLHTVPQPVISWYISTRPSLSSNPPTILTGGSVPEIKLGIHVKPVYRSYCTCNSIQNFHLWRYIGYTVGNLVLWRRVSRAVKHDYRTYIHQYTSPNENFEYSYPNSNALLPIFLKLKCCKPH